MSGTQMTTAFNAKTSVERFWLWWSGELKQCVPQRLRSYLSPERSTLAITTEKFSTDRSPSNMHNATRTVTLGSFYLTDGDTGKLLQSEFSTLPEDTIVSVYLGADHLLQRTVILPLAAEDNLESVIGFELDRLTPFTLDGASFAYQVLARFPELDKIQVEIFVTQKIQIDTLVTGLRAHGITVSAVYPVTQSKHSQSPKSLNMLAPGNQDEANSWINSRVRKKSLIAAFLLVLTLIYPLWQLERTRQTLEAEVNTLQRSASELSQQRATLLTRQDAQSQVLKRLRQTHKPLAVLEELTRLLPEHTWVQRFNLENGDVGIAGETDKASDLIEALDGSNLFGDVRFESPVTRNQKSNQSRYDIRMALVQKQ